MKVSIKPSKNLDQAIKIPPSKSLAHRLIIGACLSQGRSIIKNVDYSKDIIATLNAMKVMGAKIEENGSTLFIEGIKEMPKTEKVIDCNESGSTLRFLIPLFSLSNHLVRFIGKGRLLQRPQSVYADLFKKEGLYFHHDEDKIDVLGTLKGGYYQIKGDISSQFITGLLFTLPLLKVDSCIEVLEPFESRSYVLLTLDVLRQYQIETSFEGNMIKVKGGQTFQPLEASVEGDFSQLAFLAALGTINSPLTITGLNPNSLQGDKAILSIIKAFNGQFDQFDSAYRFYPSDLKATVVDLKDCPDLGPMVMALAAIAKGKTHIINALRLRIKESDRIAAMQEELIRLGVNVSSTEDEVFIEGQSVIEGNQHLKGHNDHRIVMALSILSTICQHPNTIDDALAIEKSYPSFFDDLISIKVEVAYED